MQPKDVKVTIRGRGELLLAVHLHIPFGQAIHHLLQGCLVAPPTFPVEQLPGVPIERFPDPELAPLCLEDGVSNVDIDGNNTL
jgi:hypothetical protein